MPAKIVEPTTRRKPGGGTPAKSRKTPPAAAALPPPADTGPTYHRAPVDPLEWTDALADEHADIARDVHPQIHGDTMNRWRYDGPVPAVRAYLERVGCDLEQARQIVESWARRAGYEIPADADYTVDPLDVPDRDPMAVEPAVPVNPPATFGLASDGADDGPDPLDAYEEAPPAAPPTLSLVPDPEAQPAYREAAEEREPTVRDEHPPRPTRELGHKVEDVFVVLDELDFRERAQSLARVEGELTETEKRHQQIKADMKAEITALEAKRSKLALIVESGREARPSRIRIEADYEAGVVREIIVDGPYIGRLHKSRTMRDDERQQSMFGRGARDDEGEP